MNQATKQDVAAFLEARSFCVIATVGADAKPEAAFVGYSNNGDLELIIGTSNKSRKFKNMTGNTSVALVVAELAGEVQYEGQVEIISSDAYATLIDESRFKKLPGFDKYRQDPSEVYLHIRPTWVRFIVHGESDQVTEFTEF